MIVVRQGRPAAEVLWALPPYVSTPPDSNEILGQSVELHVIVGQMLTWRQRLEKRAESDPETLEGFRDYATILARLEELWTSPEADELGLVRPSRSAIEQVQKIAFQMAAMGVLASPDDISTDRDGTIRITWMKEARFLELVAPYEPGEQPYFYHSAAEGDYGIESDTSPPGLVARMRWLEGAPAR